MKQYNGIYVHFLIVAFSLVLLMPIHAQTYTNLRLRAEKLFINGEYLSALECFEKYEVSKEPYIDELFLRRKSECYFRTGKFNKAVDCYYRTFDVEPEYIDYSYFAQLIRRSGKLDEYKKHPELKELLQDASGQLLINKTAAFDLSLLNGINTNKSEFGGVEIDNFLYFYSNNKRFSSQKDKNTKLPYYNTYRVKLDDLLSVNSSNDTVLTLDRVRKINDSFNVGPISCYNNSEVYITTNKRQKKHIDPTFNLYLQTSKYKNSKFSKPKESEFNNYFQSASVGHITFSPDNTMACMVVKRKEDKGSNLYFSELDDLGNWGKPYSAGNTINTKGNEQFPYWAEDNTLYFSSDGHGGLGGLDVFKINPFIPNEQPKNLGKGINSTSDDFAFYIKKDGTGYVSSNRAGGKGSDDIYHFNSLYGSINIELLCDTIWASEPWFVLRNQQGDIIKTLNVRQSPKVMLEGLPYDNYILHQQFPADSIYGIVELYKAEHTFYIDYPKSDTLEVRFANFGFDQAVLSVDVRNKLEEVIRFLKVFPELELVVEGNTDMFGSESYNKLLGLRRANAMRDILRVAGITNKISCKSNGKSKLVSRNNHLLNRRVDIKFYTPDTHELVTNIAGSDKRLKQDKVINYQSANEFDTHMQTGYYIKLYRSSRFISKENIAAKLHLNADELFIYSAKENEFVYYYEVCFLRERTAINFIDKTDLKGIVEYIE